MPSATRPARLPGLLLLLTLAACGGDDPTGPGDGPVAVEFEGVSAGAGHACAWTTAGAVYCWGANTRGQLGLGDVSRRAIPTRVPLDEPVRAVAAADSTTCALTDSGAPYCWGDNRHGEVGVDSLGGRFPSPQRVEGGHAFARLDASFETVCATTSEGDIFCWGRNFRYLMGEEGPASCPETSPGGCAPTPFSVHPGYRIEELAMGMGHICGLRGGVAQCWGWNQLKQLGDPTDQTVLRRQPASIAGSLRFEKLRGGVVQTCGITAAAEVHCWGTGALGSSEQPALDGTSYEALRVEGLRASTVSSTQANTVLVHACALDEAGAAWCWGVSPLGGLGTTAVETTCRFGSHTFPDPFPCSRTPVPVEGGLSFRTIDAGEYFTCGVTTERRVWCWGANGTGQLGDGTITDRSTPVPVVHPGPS